MENKTFFNPGNIVQVKHDDNSPKMYVVERVDRVVKSKDGDQSSIFVGVKCRWFDLNLVLQEAVFSTKDLIHYGHN